MGLGDALDPGSEANDPSGHSNTARKLNGLAFSDSRFNYKITIMPKLKSIKFIDLFCGIGGFRSAMEKAAKKHGLNPVGVFASDIDTACQKAYEHNYGEKPVGDITKVSEKDIPNHDVLLAGFPCQPFSIIGNMKGFEDTRGTLFFDIARILKEKRPRAFVLENVKLLVGHDGGKTLAKILATLREMDYHVEYRVLNSLNFGLPQKRERIWIVGLRDSKSFEWPKGGMKMKPLSDILEKKVPEKFFASETIRRKRLASYTPKIKGDLIWHENKAGNISAYPYSCALRAGASYNYLLVNGERRLTPREMVRLQGFPDSFKIISNDSQARKQAGNSLPVNVAYSVLDQVIKQLIS